MAQVMAQAMAQAMGMAGCVRDKINHNSSASSVNQIAHRQGRIQSRLLPKEPSQRGGTMIVLPPGVGVGVAVVPGAGVAVTGGSGVSVTGAITPGTQQGVTGVGLHPAPGMLEGQQAPVAPD